MQISARQRPFGWQPVERSGNTEDAKRLLWGIGRPPAAPGIAACQRAEDRDRVPAREPGPLRQHSAEQQLPRTRGVGKVEGAREHPVCAGRIPETGAARRGGVQCSSLVIDLR